MIILLYKMQPVMILYPFQEVKTTLQHCLKGCWVVVKLIITQTEKF